MFLTRQLEIGKVAHNLSNDIPFSSFEPFFAVPSEIGYKIPKKTPKQGSRTWDQAKIQSFNFQSIVRNFSY